MKRLYLLVPVFSILLIGCQDERKADAPATEETAVDALPENIGDKNAPTAIKALKGAKEVKKRIDTRREQDTKVLQESN